MKKKKVFAVITYVFFLLFFLILYCFNNFSIEEDRLFFVLICSFMIVWGLYLYSFLKRNIDILEPITFVTFMYSIFFIFEPMLDILENKTMTTKCKRILETSIDLFAKNGYSNTSPRPVTPSESFVLKEKRATSAFSTSSWVSQSVLAPYFLVSRKSSQLAKREQQRARLAIINIFFIAIVVCVG